MKNPFGPQQDPGLYSYINLQPRMLAQIMKQVLTDMFSKLDDSSK